MKLKKISLEYIQKNGFSSSVSDGVRHVKTLPYLSVAQAIEGNYDIKLGNSEVYNTGIGGFFIAPSNVQQTIVHNADKISKNMICRWVFLKINLNNLYHFDDLYDLPVILPETYKKEMNLIFDRLFATENLFEEYVYYYEIVRILSLILKEKKDKMPLYLDRVLNYIEENYRNKITVHTLAECVNLSDSHFFSCFKKAMGVSPIAYLNNYRLSCAVDLMLRTDNTITEISDIVGINDSVYFNKMFRKAYQMSPTKFREIYKNSRD